MRLTSLAGFALAIAVLASQSSVVKAFGSQEMAYASVGGETSIPYGWVDFCQRYKGECDRRERQAARRQPDRKAMQEIQQVNSWVNTTSSRLRHGSLGRGRSWDYPTDGKGDCEDYAFMKRKILIERGFRARRCS